MNRKDSTVAVTIATVSAAVSDEVQPPGVQVCAAAKDTENISEEFKIRSYPFAVVLRIRVLQVVCGISTMVMGTVGFIEEKGELNLGLGIPAGAATVLAAGASIHTTRGFGGYKPSSCSAGTLLSRLRFLGPSVGAASVLTCMWTTAFVLHLTLTGLACQTLAREDYVYMDGVYTLRMMEDEDWNKKFMAAIIMLLSMTTLLSVLVMLRVDCLYDPD